jgi:hypothetical protein
MKQKQPKPYWKDVLRGLQEDGSPDRQIIVLNVADQSGQRGGRPWSQWFVVLIFLLGVVAQVLRLLRR